MKLKDYMDDGANYQAQGVLACLRASTIEQGWNKDRAGYDAEPEIARWENCREQGYVAMLRVDGNQLNIAWFEHRNSDEIVAVKWEQLTINAPNIDTAKFGTVYKTKHDVSHNVPCEQFREMAEWIAGEFVGFYAKQRN